MCLLVVQTMASELLLGGGVHEDYFNRLTFSLKEAPFCLCPITRLPQSVFNRGYGLLGYISFLAAVIVVFFASQACPTKKNCVAFCRRRRPDGICLPTFIFFALPLDVAQPAAPINAAYLAFMLIVSIS